MTDWYNNPTRKSDIIQQALWEHDIEQFEQEVKRQKEKIRASQKSFFPWRLRLVNINKNDR